MTQADALAALRQTLEAELADALAGAQSSYAAATDPDSKAENKYDTRSLEASYLARGQSRRVTELRDALAAFATLPATPADGSVGLGSLITLATPDGAALYLMGPCEGGTEVPTADGPLLVITPASPLGGRLMGKTVGATVTLQPGRPPLTLLRIG